MKLGNTGFYCAGPYGPMVIATDCIVKLSMSKLEQRRTIGNKTSKKILRKSFEHHYEPTSNIQLGSKFYVEVHCFVISNFPFIEAC